MDLQKICITLGERFPEWGKRIALLEIREKDGRGIAFNDGRCIYYSERLMNYLTEENQSFYLAQQLVHLQLNHFERGKDKDPRVWKRASDAVVNAMLRAEGFAVPEDAVMISDAQDKSAEEIYEVLFEEQENAPEIEVSGMQMDFDWFPGTTIRDGVIRHEFRAYPVSYAEILLDTSASVDADLLRAFVRGVKGLMRQDAVVRVGCFDTRFYGFQDINSEQDIQNLQLSGAGGTDFHAAIHAFTGDAENRIIFTDGYAEMPEERCDAIWVVYGNAVIHPQGGRVLYVRPTEEKEKHEIDFLIT